MKDGFPSILTEALYIGTINSCNILANQHPVYLYYRGQRPQSYKIASLFKSCWIFCLGFVQSYGLKNADNVREEFVKPIMFSGGIGYMPHTMIKKNKPEKGKVYACYLPLMGNARPIPII